MTDPNLAEQAEREIADQLGFTSGVKHLFNPLVQDVSVEAARVMWQALVRDRCSLLKLRALLDHVWSEHVTEEDDCEMAVEIRCALEGE